MEYQGKNLISDFEVYLEKNMDWKLYRDSELKWVETLEAKMDKVSRLTAEESKQLKNEDLNWWIDLCVIQKIYGNNVDIFGKYLEEKGLTSQQNGQFFTPMSICIMMTQLVDNDTPEKIPCTVSDCASGTGRMMIAHSIVKSNKEDYSPQQYQYTNQDIDFKSFVFSTLNASLRNLWSVNIWGDTLAVTERKTYVTIPTQLGYAAWYNRAFELEKQKIYEESIKLKVV